MCSSQLCVVFIRYRAIYTARTSHSFRKVPAYACQLAAYAGTCCGHSRNLVGVFHREDHPSTTPVNRLHQRSTGEATPHSRTPRTGKLCQADIRCSRPFPRALRGNLTPTTHSCELHIVADSVEELHYSGGERSFAIYRR